MPLLKNFCHLTSQVIENEDRSNKEVSRSRYTTEIKEVAISLHFYSPKTYMFLRKCQSLPILQLFLNGLLEMNVCQDF